MQQGMFFYIIFIITAWTCQPKQHYWSHHHKNDLSRLTFNLMESPLHLKIIQRKCSSRARSVWLILARKRITPMALSLTISQSLTAIPMNVKASALKRRNKISVKISCSMVVAWKEPIVNWSILEATEEIVIARRASVCGYGSNFPNSAWRPSWGLTLF